MGSTFKILTVYPTAWWRHQGLNGYSQGNLPTVALTVNASPPSATPGVLASFVAANRALSLGHDTHARWRQAILSDLVTYWGPRAAEPVDDIEKNLGEENWVTGGFSSFMTSSTLTSVGPDVWESLGALGARPDGVKEKALTCCIRSLNRSGFHQRQEETSAAPLNQSHRG